MAQTKILKVLQTLPKTGKVKANRAMQLIGISERRNVRGVGSKQRERLISHFDGTASLIIVVSGPGGAGRAPRLAALEADPRLWLSRSWTTRERRPGEPAGAYHFVDLETFEGAVEAGGFLEWVEFLDYLQGTPIPDPPPGSDVLLEIDVQGARQIKEQQPDALLIFVDTPSREVQAERLRARGDDDASVAKRLVKADEEVEVARQLGAHFVVNDDLDRAVADVQRIITSAR